jgi:hypothetical protein
VNQQSRKPVYQIAQWDKLYENSQSRKVDKLRWVPMPNHHDGKGFRRLMTLPDAVEIYGAWALIVQVASKCPTRGVLLDADGPLLAEDLSLKTGGSAKTFERALQVLSSERIAWLLVDGSQSDTTTIPDDATRAGLNGMEGMELKEGKGREKAAGSAADLPASLRTESFIAAFADWMQHRKEIGKSYKPLGLKTLISQLAEWGPEKSIASIRRSIANGYQGLFEESGNGKSRTPRVGPGQQFDPNDTDERTF